MARSLWLSALIFSFLSPAAQAQAPPKRDMKAIELVGRASDYWYSRNWRSYYWRDDFTFLLKEDGTNKVWRIISREPTPHYGWRMGPTYTGLKVDWKARPRVRVIGVQAVDRIPADFYDFQLDPKAVATAFIVRVETKADEWKDFFVNNWFHKWGDQADRAIHAAYADKKAPYDIYGYVSGMAAPFSKKSRAIFEQHKKAGVFHGQIKSTKDNAFGFEVELLHLVAAGKVVYGDPQGIPRLDDQAPPRQNPVPKRGGQAVPGRRFTDVTAASGLRVVPKKGFDGCKPHGVGVEDFNGDGLPDIIIGTFAPPHLFYYRNLGNLRFQDATAGSGLQSYQGKCSGICIGDFDRDGKPDVFIASLQPGESRLYQGKGDGTFTDVTARSGVLAKAARSCAWSDIDGDGWLDLYITSPNGHNYLFRNNRNGTFTDIAQKAGVALTDRESLGCAFGSVTGDGLDDLFVANYHSQVSSLFQNLGGGRFKDITAEAGLTRKMSAVGCTFGDVFNRGRLDLYVSTDSWLSGANYTEAELRKQGHTVEPNVLYVNDGKGKFTPLPEPLFNYKTMSHDAILEDLDHDGLIDIYVAADGEDGEKWVTSKGGNPLWTRPDGKSWREASAAWGVNHVANCVCAVAADFDNDGDLDLLLVNFYSNVVLYRNDTNDKNWLRVKAVGARSNLDGIGARVSVYDQKKRVGYRHVQSGAGYARCSPLEAHFGLGKTPAAGYRVEVFFPATKTRLVRDNVKPGQRLLIKESDAK